MLIVVSEHPFADDHVQVLKHAIETGLRKKFTVFDKETLLQKVHDIYNTIKNFPQCIFKVVIIIIVIAIYRTTHIPKTNKITSTSDDQ